MQHNIKRVSNWSLYRIRRVCIVILASNLHKTTQKFPVQILCSSVNDTYMNTVEFQDSILCCGDILPRSLVALWNQHSALLALCVLLYGWCGTMKMKSIHLKRFHNLEQNLIMDESEKAEEYSQSVYPHATSMHSCMELECYSWDVSGV